MRTESSVGIRVAHESRNLELDGLRGLAVILVMVYHLDPGRMFWLWSGVDLFMVLSGFLIMRVVLQSRARGRWSLRNFWIRRVLRIWPLYFIGLLACVAALLLREIQEPGVFAQTRHSAFVALFAAERCLRLG